MPGEPSPLTPDEAIEWHRNRLAMSPTEFKALQSQAKKQAFTVSGIVQESLIADAQAALGAALTEGTTLEEFKALIGGQLEANWAGTVANPAARIETIFRTNTQSAYNVGRHKQANDPDVIELRPFWRYVAILDARTSPECRAAHGTLLPADHPWWQTHFPPLHFNCRCTFEALTPRQAGRVGLTEKPSELKGGEGFGGQPAHD